tara:strand:+ start:576 stop:782 length:207 start_codon:yes stop_codon:yes gene_type:complete
MNRENFYESVHNYTKFKLIEILIEKYKDKSLDNLNVIEKLSDDILDIISLCGLKFYGEIKHNEKEKKK